LNVLSRINKDSQLLMKFIYPEKQCKIKLKIRENSSIKFTSQINIILSIIKHYKLYDIHFIFQNNIENHVLTNKIYLYHQNKRIIIIL
jgi:hypothetical protein